MDNVLEIVTDSLSTGRNVDPQVEAEQWDFVSGYAASPSTGWEDYDYFN